MNQDIETPSPSLAETLTKYNISLPAKKIRLLEAYCAALWEWNGRLNLTRHTDYEKFVTRDIVDSIHLAARLQTGERILDVGTGGGVPGVVLAILRPDLSVELCDSTGKKAKALGEILDAVGLDLNVWHAKAEELVKMHRFHTLVIRAVSKMEKLLAMFAPCWFAFDRILMVKGPNWVEERGEARHFGRLDNLALRKVDDYRNPGAEHESVILQVCRKVRLDEMKQRELDLAQGLPIAELSESVGVDNRPASAFEKKPNKKFVKKFDKKFDGRSGKKGPIPPGADSERSGAKPAERKKSGPFPRRSREKDGSDKSEKRGKGWVHPDTPFHGPTKNFGKNKKKPTDRKPEK